MFSVPRLLLLAHHFPTNALSSFRASCSFPKPRSATRCVFGSLRTFLCPTHHNKTTSTPDNLTATSSVDGDVLPFRGGPFDSVAIHLDQVPESTSVAHFAARLSHSVATWRSQRKKSVSIQVPIERSHLIPAAAQVGFEFHHAHPKHSTLSLWLSDTPCKVPHYASHRVGVGGFVLNSKNEVLTIQDRFSPLAGWKLPGE